MWRRGRLGGRGPVGPPNRRSGRRSRSGVVAYYYPYGLARELVDERDPAEAVRYSADVAELSLSQRHLTISVPVRSRSRLGITRNDCFPALHRSRCPIVALIPPVSPVALYLVPQRDWSSPGTRRSDPSGRVYPLLRAWLPAFRIVRAPARFAIIVLLGMSVLTAIGLVRIATTASRRSRDAGCGGDAHPGIRHDTSVDSKGSRVSDRAFTPGSASSRGR